MAKMADNCSRKNKKGSIRKFSSFRHPKGSGSAFILLLNLMVFSYQQGASYNLVTLITSTTAWKKADPWFSAFLSAIVIDCVPKLLYPLAGWLADAKYGRYRVIRGGLLIMWAVAVLLLTTSIVKYSISDISSTDDNLVNILTIPVVVVIYLFGAIGTACFHVNIIPFGIDQMEDGSSEEITSFVYWYYWTRNMNFGILIQFAISSTPSYCNAHQHRKDSYDLVINLLQVMFLAVALCLDRLWCKTLNVDPKIHNPMKKVKAISKYILEHDKPVGYRKAETYTYDAPPTRSDFAKETYGGMFSEDDVEDVTAFWRIVVFLVAIGFSGFLIQSGTYSYPLYFDHMKKQRVDIACSDKYVVTNVVSMMTFTICIPVFEFFIYPLFRNYIPRIIRRIGLGMLVMLIGHGCLFAIDFTAHQLDHSGCLFFYSHSHVDFSPFYLVPIIIIMSIGELLVFIAVLEFLCAQSPYNMRGLIIGILFFLYGIFNALVSLVMLIFALAFKHASSSVVLSCGSSYTLGVVSIGIFGFVLYIFTAKWYKKRQRGGQNNINHQSVVEDYFEQRLFDSSQLMYLHQRS